MTKTQSTAGATAPATTRKPRTPVDKPAQLLKLANQRVPRALRAIELIGSLGKYSPNDVQVDRIHTALQEAIDQSRNKLMAGSQAAPSKFTL